MTTRSWSLAASLLIAAGLILAPMLMGTNDYDLGQSEYVLSLVLVAIGFNLATGYAGQLTLGPGATFLAGAYACGILANEKPDVFGSLWVMCVVGIVAAVLLGLVMAVPALRIGGFYLAVVTLFVALVLPEIFSFFDWAGGEVGISLVSNVDFSKDLNGIELYEICVGFVLLTVLGVWALMNSRMGRRLLALQASDELTASAGVSTYTTKMWAFLLSSIPAGLGGAIYVYSQQFVSPGSADANTSIYLVAACILGGMGTLWGPVLGTVAVVEAQQHLGSLKEYLPIAFAALLLVCTLLLPFGVVGLIRQLLPRAWVRADGSAAVVAPRAFVDALKARTADTSLVARGITCRYGGIRAVDRVDIEVKPGTVHALIGSNGSGKTTLLNALSGFGRAQEGAVMLGTRKLLGARASRIARLSVSRTFQTPKVMPAQTAVTNVMLAVDRKSEGTALESMLRLPRGRRGERHAGATARTMLGQVGLGSLAGAPATAVPHGGLRLLEVARVLASEPDFVLLDEPAAGLTAKEISALREAIEGMSAAGIGVLLVEHNTTFVFEVADEITVLHQGRVIAHGTPAEIAAHEEVIAAYLGSGRTTRNIIEGAASLSAGRAT